MFFIKGYLYFFQLFIVLLIILCEAVCWLLNPRLTWPLRRLNEGRFTSLLNPELG